MVNKHKPQKNKQNKSSLSIPILVLLWSLLWVHCGDNRSCFTYFRGSSIGLAKLLPFAFPKLMSLHIPCLSLSQETPIRVEQLQEVGKYRGIKFTLLRTGLAVMENWNVISMMLWRSDFPYDKSLAVWLPAWVSGHLFLLFGQGEEWSGLFAPH